jgi:hypothetical protein
MNTLIGEYCAGAARAPEHDASGHAAVRQYTFERRCVMEKNDALDVLRDAALAYQNWRGTWVRADSDLAELREISEALAALEGVPVVLDAETWREAREALIIARGALRLDAMVDELGRPFGTTTDALEAIGKVLAAHPLEEKP